jgi:hypothetical protein
LVFYGWQLACEQRVCWLQVTVRVQVQKLFRAMVAAWPQVKVFWRLHIFGLCG